MSAFGSAPRSRPSVAIIGAGPAGLMAAEAAAAAGAAVQVYEAMPSAGRKLLLAGRGGLNLTHSEPAAEFLSRYPIGAQMLAPLLEAFGPDAVRAWASGLGIDTFVGSSGRVFPRDLKAAPLLRAWLLRLRAASVRFHVRHRWSGRQGDAWAFQTPEGLQLFHPGAVVLALGGGSWPRFGSDGAWVALLARAGIAVEPLEASNCGYEVRWSEHLRSRYTGAALKNITLGVTAVDGSVTRVPGECVLTDYGIEGGVVYAQSARLRVAVATGVPVELDLVPQWSSAELRERLARGRGKRSLSSHLRRALGITGVKAALVHEHVRAGDDASTDAIVGALKSLPLALERPRPLAEAISSAGGVALDAIDATLMLKSMPGVFVAGEMLAWDAPTGGYLLTACLATGRAAGAAAAEWARRVVP